MKDINDIADNYDNTSDFLDGGAELQPDFGLGNPEFEVYGGKEGWRFGRGVRLVYMGGEQPLTIARIEVIDARDGESMGLHLSRIDLDEYQYITATFLRNWMLAHLPERNLTFPIKQLDDLQHLAIKWLMEAGKVIQRADAFKHGWEFSLCDDSHDPDLQVQPEGAFPVSLLVVSENGVSRRP
ncbi:hypothetical protein KS527_004460 [Salmonella enterica]|nr:hypothetical protein [Salmonella enterica]